jgi:hypothetical protein
MNIYRLIQFLVLIFLTGCASTQMAPSKIVQRFNTQAVYQDKKNNKTQQMTLEVVARKNLNMRIDAKVILGVHIASVVMNPDRVQIALHAEKKSYEGPSTQKALQRSLGLPIHPLVFHAMLYRQVMKGSGWSCRINSEGLVTACQQSPSGLQVTWQEIEDNEVMVTAQNKNFSLQWKVPLAEQVEERPTYFVLKIPDSYEKLSL